MTASIKARVKQFERVLEEIPEITYAGNPVLRSPSADVSLAEGQEIAKRMEGVLLRYRAVTGAGRGLAAPQIGEGKSAFITYLDDQIEVFLNPKITDKSVATNFYREHCMSVAVVAADVERSAWIIMEWTDKNGERQSQRFDGFKARLYQHEEAHLRGRLNVDDVSPGGIAFITSDPLKEQLRNTAE